MTPDLSHSGEWRAGSAAMAESGCCAASHEPVASQTVRMRAGTNTFGFIAPKAYHPKLLMRHDLRRVSQIAWNGHELGRAATDHVTYPASAGLSVNHSRAIRLSMW